MEKKDVTATIAVKTQLCSTIRCEICARLYFLPVGPFRKFVTQYFMTMRCSHIVMIIIFYIYVLMKFFYGLASKIVFPIVNSSKGQTLQECKVRDKWVNISDMQPFSMHFGW